jgi:uroporphyrinogen decarboxylase
MRLHHRKPNIDNLYKVLHCQIPSRPTLFEYFMNDTLHAALAGRPVPTGADAVTRLKFDIDAFAAAGFDYATTYGCAMAFKTNEHARKGSMSLNEGFVITDEASFEAYDWPDPDAQDYSRLEKIRGFLPEGMKLLVRGPGGVLMNTIYLVGYENLCIMLHEQPQLARAIFDRMGSIIARYYETVVQYETMGLMMINDDWAFRTQTLLSPAHMREYIFPWVQRYADIGRRAGMPVLLHSCGYFAEILEDVIAMGVHGKHSYEDAILPVEEAYEQYCGRIAVLGGIDLDFILRSTPEQLTVRCRAMLERSSSRGGYALGTGNSVPEYIPQDKYLAILRAGLSYGL